MGKRTYSFNEFSKYLDEELAWRRKELNIIKNYIPEKQNPKQAAALRFNVPMLYAHFEGFVKKATELYLEFVANKFLKHSQLQTQFISLSLSSQLASLNVNNIKTKTEIIDFILDKLDSKSKIKTKNIINTKSNLKFNVFKDILFTIGINETVFHKYGSLIDDLVDSRNYIAHGEYLSIDYERYLNLYNDIQEVMENLKTELENSVVQEKYKKLTSP